MDKRKTLLAIGITFILVGGVAAGYPLYLRVQGKLEQRRLEKEFQEYTVSPAIENTDLPGPEQLPDPEPDWPRWQEFPPTRLEIPALDLEIQVVVVEDMGVFARKLSQPPSYYPQSAFPGTQGNVLIAGHRGGPAGYFKNLNRLEPGDPIILHAPGVSYRYEVEKVWVVEPSEVSVIAPLDYPALTLTTCQRVGKDPAARRLIVRARLTETGPGNGD